MTRSVTLLLLATLYAGRLASANTWDSYENILGARGDLSVFSAEEDVAPVLDKRAPSSRPMTLIANMAGKSFFSFWDFFTYPDPTHGQVQYVNQATATKNKLAYINAAGNAVLKVDDRSWLAQGANRQSVRITSKGSFSPGQLLVLHATHMPTGCTTWPAFWTVGPNWPNGGEIDIVEGVNNQVQNQNTLHTTPGCTVSSSQTPFQGTGQLLDADCDIGNDNIGCGVLNPSTQSFGPGFNKARGGAYATLWDDEGMKFWFWNNSAIPWDLRRARPVPSSWGTPISFFSSKNCNFDQYFSKNQTIIINTTLGGDWAGSVLAQTGCPNSQSSYIANPATFKQAYWEISSVRIYQ